MEDDFEFERQVGSNRLERVKDSIRDLGDPEEMMIEITGILNETVIIPDAGETYTFIYNAKTPRIEYDQHPLVGVTDVFSWGSEESIFTGIKLEIIHGKRYLDNYTL